MNLKEFNSDIKADVAAFFKWYNENKELYPDDYPDDMTSSEWFEQFLFYWEKE